MSLSHQIRLGIDASLPSERQLQIWSEAAANRVLRALGQEDHSFRNEVADLMQWVKRQKLGSHNPTLPPQILSLFYPQPGNFEPPIRKWWRVQFLLLVAAWSKRSKDLAAHLELTEDQVRKAAEYAREACHFGAMQYADLLARALALIEGELGPIVPDLEGRVLKYGEKSVRLSELESVFLESLLKSPGQAVSYEDLNLRGVKNPSHTKNRLMGKVGKGEIPLVIVPKKHAYVLHLPS
jgi:hypothetical protein